MSSVKVIVKGKARSRIALGVVTAYLRLHPNTTFKALKDVFPDSICPKAPVQFRSLVPLGVFQPLEVVQALPEIGLSIAHYTSNKEILNTSDGVTIAVTKSWTQEAFDALNIAAAMHGIAIMMVNEGEKWSSGTYELDFVDVHHPHHKPLTSTALPPSEKPQHIHKPTQNPQVSKGRRNLASLSVIALLVLMGITVLMYRGSCSGIFGSKAVDTIVIDVNEFCHYNELKEDKKQSVQAVVQDSTPAPQPKVVTPTPHKKARRDNIASHNPQKVAVKKTASNKKKAKQEEKIKKVEKPKPVKKVEQAKKVEKANKVKKAGKVDKAEKVEAVKKADKVEKVKKVENVEAVKQAEQVKKVEKTDTVNQVKEVKKIEKVDTAKQVEQVRKVEKVDTVKKVEQVKKIEEVKQEKKAEEVEKVEETQQVSPEESEYPSTPKTKKRYTQKPLI